MKSKEVRHVEANSWEAGREAGYAAGLKEGERDLAELVRCAKWVLGAWESDALEVGWEAVEDAAEGLRAAIRQVEAHRERSSERTT